MAASVTLRQMLTLCVLYFTIWAAPAHTQQIPPPAYQLAVQNTGVPSSILYAVAQQESGVYFNGRQVPWPWTLNIAGQGYRFQTRAAACRSLQLALEKMLATRIDVGLGQINIGYQAHRFDHPCELLDPFRNLSIAVAILREHHLPGEDWLLAVGRYHRPAGGILADRYRHRVHQHLLHMQRSSVPVVASRGPLP